MAEAPASELVPVYVPREHLSVVLRFLAEQLEMSGRQPGSLVHAVGEEAAPWSDDDVRRAYVESARSMRNVLDVLVERAGTEVTSDDLARAIGPNAAWPNLAGVMGAFGRRVRSRYKKAGPFFESRWDNDKEKMVYVMPDAPANAIRVFQEHRRELDESPA